MRQQVSSEMERSSESSRVVKYMAYYNSYENILLVAALKDYYIMSIFMAAHIHVTIMQAKHSW